MWLFFISGILFSAAFYYVGRRIWQQPLQAENEALQQRLREVRLRMGAARSRRGGANILRRQEAGRFASLAGFLEWMGPLRRLQQLITQADLRYKATDVFVICLGIFFVSFLLFSLFGLKNLLALLAISTTLAALPVFYINFQRNRRMARFEELLPDAIDLFNRSMKAGHNLQSGLETIASETLDPVRMEFRKVMEEISLGSQTETALHHLGERVPIIDLKFFITGLILQRQTGANMVDMLENLALLIRERLNLSAKLKAGTAQQRLSAGLLCSIPVIMFLGFWVLKPEYVDLLLNDDVGNIIMTYAVTSEIIGILVIRKLASPKF
jgi:tight adherence protein B